MRFMGRFRFRVVVSSVFRAPGRHGRPGHERQRILRCRL